MRSLASTWYIALLLVLALVPQCKRERSGGSPSKSMERIDEMYASSDLDELRRRVKLPAGVTSCRWAILPIGIKSSAPGPTDYEIDAYVALDDQASRDLPALPDAGTQTMSLSPAVAGAILPETLMREASESQGRLRITGAPLPTEDLSRPGHYVSRALKVASGMLVRVHTM